MKCDKCGEEVKITSNIYLTPQPFPLPKDWYDPARTTTVYTCKCRTHYENMVIGYRTHSVKP